LPEQRAALLQCAAWLAIWQTDHSAVRSYCKASLEICRATGNQRGSATSLAQLGAVASQQGDLVLAQELLEQSLVLAQEVGSREEMGDSLRELGWLALKQFNLSAARSLFESALAIWRELGHFARESGSHIALGSVARFEGNCDEARAHLEAGLTIARRVGARVNIGFGLSDLGLLLVRQGESAASKGWRSSPRHRESRSGPHGSLVPRKASATPSSFPYHP
jgi:tetratricopeptide (TPR) repeat protein